MNTAIVTCFSAQVAPDASGAPPEWVHLLPAGSFKGRDGRGPYRLDDATGVIAASMAEGHRPVDFNHATIHPSRGDGRAAGWIVAMEARDTGIWGKVEWTPDGRSAVAGRLFRFFSPGFREAPAGRVAAIHHAALTNDPNLDLQTVLASQLHEPGDPMTTTLLAALAALFGLKLTTGTAASADAIVTHAKTVVTGGGSGADVVPMAAFVEVRDKLAAMVAERAAETATHAVDAAIAAGKVTPAMREWAMSRATKDPADFAAYVAAAPVILPLGVSTHAGGTPPAKRQMDAEARAVAARMGLSPDDMAKTMAEG